MEIQMKKIVLIGDSIRMSYAASVRERLSGRAEVVYPDANCGNSMLVRENLHQWAIASQPDIVHFNCGIHDLGWMPGERVPRFTVSAYVRNLRLIVERLRRETSASIIFATTTPFLKPLDSNVPLEKCKPAAIVERYNTAAVRMMDRLGVPVNDLHKAVMDAGVLECMGEDRLHMSRRGVGVLASAIVRFFESEGLA